MKTFLAALLEAVSFDSNSGPMTSLRRSLSAWIILIAMVLAGGAWAQQRCHNDRCFTCNGLLACKGETCTCNGVPAQSVPAPRPVQSKAMIRYNCEFSCQGKYVKCDPSPYRPNEAKCKSERAQCVSSCIARN